jgi:hypothetical protein
VLHNPQVVKSPQPPPVPLPGDDYQGGDFSFSSQALVKGTNLSSQLSRVLVRVFPGISKFLPGTPRPLMDRERKGGGLRRPSTRFTSRARNNCLEKMCRLERLPDAWITLTDNDDYIMEKFGKHPGIETLCKDLKYQFNLWTQRKDVQAVLEWYAWRIEKEPRKSGIFKGLEVPHFHVMVGLKKADSKEIILAGIDPLLKGWVAQLNAPGPKHEQVTLHHRSYSILDGRKKAFSYMSKYSAKTNQSSEYIDPETGEVKEYILGRQWGFSSKAPISKGILLSIPRRTADSLRRMLRKTVKKRIKDAARKGRKYRPGVYFWDSLKDRKYQFKMMILDSEIFRFIEFSIRDYALYSDDPVPF